MTLPIYAHPTLTVLVDDSSPVLQSLAARAPAHGQALQHKAFHQAGEALDWLMRSPRHAAVPLRVNHDLPGCSVTVDVEGIFRLSRQRERFGIPSVLVADFYMPGMNGLDFFRALQHLPCKKILLAGAGEERIAVDALNEGWIDRYVRKQDADVLPQLEGQIGAMRQAWFLDQARTERELLALHDYSFLRCPRLAAVVQALYQRHGFVEHYIFPGPNGLLLIDAAGEAQLMVVETERGMQAQYEIARDSGAPRPLLQALADRRVVPFFQHLGRDGMYDKSVNGGWQAQCRAPEICRGDETYYWALFALPASYLREPPYSHADYLRDAA